MEDDVTVASTTATQEELDHAVSSDWRISPQEKEPQKIEDEKPAEGDQPETESASEADQPESKDAPAKKDSKPESKAEKRIRELTRDREYARQLAEERAEENRKLQERLERIEQGLAAKPQPKSATDEDPEPKEEDFADQGSDFYKKFLTAHGRWAARQEYQEQRAKEQQEAEASEQAEQEQALSQRTKAKFDAYNSRIDDVRKKYPDWDAVINRPDVPITSGMQLAITARDNGPEIAYFLGKNPEVAGELFEMDAPDAIAEIGAISLRLKNESSRSLPVRPVSNAAQPIKPVGRSATTSTKDPNTMSMEEYNEWRNNHSGARSR